MRVLYYILDSEGEPVPIEGAADYGRWRAENEDAQHVAKTQTAYHLVSTVFLFIDHNAARFESDDAPPILFETMVFEWETAKREFFGDNPPDESMADFTIRYSTRAAALKGHEDICDMVLNFEKSCIKARKNP